MYQVIVLHWKSIDFASVEWAQLNNWWLCCWMRLFPRYRSHGLHAASGGRPAVVARFPRRISLPRLPLDAVHPSQQRAALHARAWYLSRIARHVIDFHSTRPYLHLNPLKLHSFSLLAVEIDLKLIGQILKVCRWLIFSRI
jgi:hypothetical protein